MDRIPLGAAIYMEILNKKEWIYKAQMCVLYSLLYIERLEARTDAPIGEPNLQKPHPKHRKIVPLLGSVPRDLLVLRQVRYQLSNQLPT